MDWWDGSGEGHWTGGMEVVKVGVSLMVVDRHGSGEGRWTGGMEVVKVSGLVGWKW